MPSFRRAEVLRRGMIAAAHVALILLAYVLACNLRFDFAVPADERGRLIAAFPVLAILQFASLGWFGLYRSNWAHFGLRDLLQLCKALTLSALLFSAVLFVTEHLDGMPRSVVILDWALALLLLGGVRLAVRCRREAQMPWRRRQGKRTLVIGAGEAAERLLRQLHHETGARIDVIGLLDDNPVRRSLLLHGVPVVGTIDELPRVIASRRVELIVIAIPSATGEQMRRIVDLCAATRVTFKVLPSLWELLEGGARVDQLRDVRIDDLLGREPVALDMSFVERDLAGRVVLITGGAGSIGSELARQVARFGPARLVLLDQAESPLYFVQLEVAAAFRELDVVPVIGDVTDGERLDQVFAQYRPDYVLHAAAYKHVPLMELNVVEAVRNNVLGTVRVAECAVRYDAAKFVLISTDKAVSPTSIMGATKRLAEHVVLSRSLIAQESTDFRAVRFGNVLGSNGSVIPLFKQQLAGGGPLTVTHPEVERYFMTIPEAVQLVLGAAALPEAAGRICMLEMGQPVRILDVAEQLIRLSGRVPYQEVPIVFTGLRPGEKLREQLVSSVEMAVPTSVEKVRIVETAPSDFVALDCGLQRLALAVGRSSVPEIVAEVRALVPEYVPSRTAAGRPRDVEVRRPVPLADRVLGGTTEPARPLNPLRAFAARQSK